MLHPLGGCTRRAAADNPQELDGLSEMQRRVQKTPFLASHVMTSACARGHGSTGLADREHKSWLLERFLSLLRRSGRSNTSTFGSLRPGTCTVIDRVFPSSETPISSVPTAFPPILVVNIAFLLFTWRVFSEARAVADKIAALQKQLAAILITHPYSRRESAPVHLIFWLNIPGALEVRDEGSGAA